MVISIYFCNFFFLKQLIFLVSRRRDFKQTNPSKRDFYKYNLKASSKQLCNMLSPKCFSVNPKKTTCGVKLYKERWFSKKKCLNHSITLLQQSSDKRDAQLFCYFGYKKSIEKYKIYQK